MTATHFPEWRGNALMGNLWHEHLGRFTIDGHDVEFAERLVDDQGWRIRDVASGRTTASSTS
jgi:aldose sugar dehydrogenase